MKTLNELNQDVNNIELGLRIVDLLGIRVNKNGRINTSWGDKTHLGLALTIKRVIEDHESERGLR